MRPERESRQGKVLSLTALSIAEVLAMAVWFSASAVVPQLKTEWDLSTGQVAWVSMSLQVGFVVGAFASAILNLPDRFSSRTIFAVGAAGAAVLNASVVAVDSYTGAIVARFLTGAMLAGVYPPGMKLVASWTTSDRGLYIGVLVGSLTLGSALPHLIAAISPLGLPGWEHVLIATSLMALAASALVMLAVRQGPFLPGTAPFQWKYLASTLSHKPTRLANFGYLGHMWELYAAWVWVPMLLIEVYEASGYPEQWARVSGFLFIGSGAVGCVIAGVAADRRGRTTVTIVSLMVSGACCAIAGFLLASPLLFTVVCLVWGMAVVADSAQFSAAITELADPRYVGTALTLQTSLGFLLTLVSIRVVPLAVDFGGWTAAFMVLLAGPAFGIWGMATLRKSPEALQMASGKR
jgi:MFS family permease